MVTHHYCILSLKDNSKSIIDILRPYLHRGYDGDHDNLLFNSISPSGFSFYKNSDRNNDLCTRWHVTKKFYNVNTWGGGFTQNKYVFLINEGIPHEVIKKLSQLTNEGFILEVNSLGGLVFGKWEFLPNKRSKNLYLWMCPDRLAVKSHLKSFCKKTYSNKDEVPSYEFDVEETLDEDGDSYFYISFKNNDNKINLYYTQLKNSDGKLLELHKYNPPFDEDCSPAAINYSRIPF